MQANLTEMTPQRTTLAGTLLKLIFASALATTTTLAQYGLTIDENGNGALTVATNTRPLPGALGVDPLSGITTLCYDLTALEQQFQFTFNSGDVLIPEPNGLSYSDLVRFEQNNPAHPGAFIYFFSDLEAGQANSDLADVGVPQVFGTNSFALETGVEGNNQAAYQPLGSAQAGFVPQAPVTYTFISDAVPEPSLLALLALAAGGLLRPLARRRSARP